MDAFKLVESGVEILPTIVKNENHFWSEAGREDFHSEWLIDRDGRKCSFAEWERF